VIKNGKIKQLEPRTLHPPPLSERAIPIDRQPVIDPASQTTQTMAEMKQERAKEISVAAGIVVRAQEIAA